MKKILFTITAVVIAHTSFAQTHLWTPTGTNIYNTNPGNVGIGTSSPFKRLHILGGNMAVSTSDFNASGTGSVVVMGQDGTTGNVYSLIQAATNGPNSGGTLSLNPNGGNVGIGTTSPGYILDVAGTMRIGKVSDGTSLILSGKPGTSYNYTFDSRNGNYLSVVSQAPGATPFVLDYAGNVGIGTTAPDAKLAVYGTIHSREVKVDLNVPGPDYVFDSDYKLAELSELKAYVDKHHHLPEIPSADQMTKDGLDLGDMNIKLLKKVEELTLYLLEQQKQIDQLKKYVKSTINVPLIK
jgi:hypothetical protein